MNGRLLICFFLLVLLPAGCVTANKKATDLADQALYQPAVYENASVPGPEIVVLPGEIKSSNFSFVQKVTSNNLRDFAEIELSKDNFKVLDRADVQPFFQEIALAANLGDAEALKVFRKGRFQTTNWFLTFNILKAEPTVFVTKGFDGATAGALIDLAFTIANKGEKSSAGKMIGQTVASAKSADTSAIWLVGLQYKILNATTGEQVASGYIEDKMEATTSMNSFLGATNQQNTSITLDTMAQRLIQKAVAEIDKKYKKDAGSATATDDNPSGKKKKKDVIDSKKEKSIQASYTKKLQEQQVQRDKDAAITAMRCYNDGYANLNQESVLATLAKENHEKFHKKYDKMFSIPNSSPKWRDKIKIDLSQLSCELVDYKSDACKVKVSGAYSMTVDGKTKSYAKDRVIDMVKTDGQWKVASWQEEDDKEVTQQ
jgi:hypothetical protein